MRNVVATEVVELGEKIIASVKQHLKEEDCKSFDVDPADIATLETPDEFDWLHFLLLDVLWEDHAKR